MTHRSSAQIAPALDSGWRIETVTRGYRAVHPTYGATQPWARPLSALWAAKIVELAARREQLRAARRGATEGL